MNAKISSEQTLKLFINQWKNQLFIFPLIIVTLGLAIWVAINIVQRPYTEIEWLYQNGLVVTVDPEGTANQYFRVGDFIVSIDTIPVYQARGLPGYHIGDTVNFLFKRNGTTLHHEIILKKIPLSKILLQLSTILVALSFWALGFYVFVKGKFSLTTSLFMIECETFANILIIGAISSFGPIWCSVIFGFLLWWIGPLLIYLHLLLIQRIANQSVRNWLKALFLVSLVFSISSLFELIPPESIFIHTLKYVWLSITLIVAAAILLWASLSGRPIEMRQKTRIIGLSALAAFLPFILLSLMPEIFFHTFFLPYEITFLALPILPLGYSYAILRYQLIKTEYYVNRGISFAFSLLFAVSIYTLGYLLIPKIIQGSSTFSQILNITLNIVIIVGINPLFHIIEHWLEKLFYGGWYDDRIAAQEISQAIVQVKGDTLRIAQELCWAIQKTLQLEYVNLLLSDGYLISTGKVKMLNSFSDLNLSKIHFSITENFINSDQVAGPGKDLQNFLFLPENEKMKIAGSNPQYWILLAGKQMTQGLLVLGRRRGGNEFAPGDLEILEVVLRQAGTSLENAYLLNEVQVNTQQIRELHYQVLKAHEEERKRVSRELHDKIIQALIGINYQIAVVRSDADPKIERTLIEIQGELRAILGDLRQVCADLRPPVLDALGLSNAIQIRVEEFRDQLPIDIDLTINGLDKLDLAEVVSVCIYRFLQEALINIYKHAKANSVHIDFEFCPDEYSIHCSIQDDGVGFIPPIHLTLLSQQHHFGLISLQEQIEAIGGLMKIESQPGNGCHLTATIPIINEIST